MTAEAGGRGDLPLWFVGADPASRRPALAAVSDDRPGVVLADALDLIRDSRELHDRLVAVREWARDWLAPLAETGVLCAVVEQPTTRGPATALMASYGVLLEAVRSVVAAPVVALPPSSWKVRALGPGRGSAGKLEVLAFARAHGLPDGAGQDEADAVGCALAARALVEGVFDTSGAAA